MVTNQTTSHRGQTLPRHCSTDGRTTVDTLLFGGPVASIGAFRCPVSHPAFRDSGPIERCIVVFPRTSVWIRFERSRRFVADPNVVTIYNRGQRYERAPLSPDGDRCDWFALSDDAAREIAGAFDPAAAELERGPFRFERAACSPALYLEQRRVAQRVASGTSDMLETEEAVVSIVGRVLAGAYERTRQPLVAGDAARKRRADLVEHAKAELSGSVTLNRSAADVARSVGTSVFHLCRIFRAHTGLTMHHYRTELRVRLALELLDRGGARTSLSNVAHQLGFASHSHFVRLCRQQLGAPPGAVREQLRLAMQGSAGQAHTRFH